MTTNTERIRNVEVIREIPVEMIREVPVTTYKETIREVAQKETIQVIRSKGRLGCVIKRVCMGWQLTLIPFCQSEKLVELRTIQECIKTVNVVKEVCPRC